MFLPIISLKRFYTIDIPIEIQKFGIELLCSPMLRTTSLNHLNGVSRIKHLQVRKFVTRVEGHMHFFRS